MLPVLVSIVSFGGEILVEDIIPKKGGQCSFYLKLPKIKVLKEKIGSKFDTTRSLREGK